MASLMLGLTLFLIFFKGVIMEETNGTEVVLPPQKSITDNLECVYQISGVFNGETYEDDHREAETCEDGITFCQKITAHYFEVAANVKTEILMKGCDGVSIPQQFEGISCQREGCNEKIFEGETYNVCCCSTALCNASSQFYHLLLIMVVCTLLL